MGMIQGSRLGLRARAGEKAGADFVDRDRTQRKKADEPAAGCVASLFRALLYA
jgi:hypothetical protein